MYLFSRVWIVLGTALTCIPALAVPFQTAGPVDGGVADTSLDQNVRVATDGAGTWVAVYEGKDTSTSPDYDIFAVYSTDDGDSWSSPVPVNSDQSNTFDDVNPEIATDGNGNWVCVWTGPGDPFGVAIWSSKSTDGGQTWSARTPVVASSAGVFHKEPHVASDGSGHWIAVWSTNEQFSDPTPEGDYEIAQATSANGTAWSAPSRVNSNGYDDDPTDNDEDPFIATDGNGNWVCVWTAYFDRGINGQGDKDLFFARSTNDGASWSTMAVPNAEFDTEVGLQEAPRLAADASGNWIMVWEGYLALPDPYDIFTCTSTDNGATWGASKNVSANSVSGAEVSPDIQYGGSGKWLCVWQRSIFYQGAGQDYDIAQSESSDNGATWSDVENVNSNAPTDTTDDWSPSVATDGNGKWVVLWHTLAAQQDLWRSISGESGGSASITLTAPNGGEKWKIGKKKKITWISSGAVGANVKLELLRNGSFVQNIKASTKNDGKQKWKIPGSLAPGSGYKVRITDTSAGSITDTSDGAFKIKAAK